MRADEFMELLESDPDYVAARDVYLSEWRAKVEENMRAAAPVEEDLARAGVHVGSISDLTQLRLKDVPAAIPVLLRWLSRLDNFAIRECIVRALTDKAARPLAGPALVEEFKRVPISDDPRLLHYKWAIANALTVVSDDLLFEDIAALLLDERHNWPRSRLAIAMQRMMKRKPDAISVLAQVLDQDKGVEGDAADPAGTAIRVLGNLRAYETAPAIKPFLDHPEPLVRKEAEKALAKLSQPK
jgi:hypothetical protein